MRVIGPRIRGNCPREENGPHAAGRAPRVINKTVHAQSKRSACVETALVVKTILQTTLSQTGFEAPDPVGGANGAPPGPLAARGKSPQNLKRSTFQKSAPCQILDPPLMRTVLYQTDLYLCTARLDLFRIRRSCFNDARASSLECGTFSFIRTPSGLFW